MIWMQTLVSKEGDETTLCMSGEQEYRGVETDYVQYVFT